MLVSSLPTKDRHFCSVRPSCVRVHDFSLKSLSHSRTHDGNSCWSPAVYNQPFSTRLPRITISTRTTRAERGAKTWEALGTYRNLDGQCTASATTCSPHLRDLSQSCQGGVHDGEPQRSKGRELKPLLYLSQITLSQGGTADAHSLRPPWQAQALAPVFNPLWHQRKSERGRVWLGSSNRPRQRTLNQLKF